MKRGTIIIAAIIFAVVAFAAPVENVISFQGKLVEAGVPVDGTRNIEFKLYDVETGGTALWTENHLGVTVAGGLFNVELGGATTFDAAGVDFTEQYWVGISVGGGAEITPRYKLTGSPYAMADGDWEVVASGVIRREGNVYIGDDGSAGSLGLRAQGPTLEGGQIIWNGAGTHDSWTQDAYADDMRFFTNSANDNQFKIANAGTGDAGLYVEGNVGIGTSTPGRKLEVNGRTQINIEATSPGWALLLRNTDATHGAYWNFKVGDDLLVLADETSGNEEFHFDGSNGSMCIGRVWAGYETAPDDGLLVKGNVGIGTTDPRVELEVVNNTGDCGIAITSGTSNLSSLHFGDDDDVNRGSIWYNNGTDEFRFRTSGSDFDVLIDADGDVAIGTSTTLGNKLNVEGTGNFFSDDVWGRLAQTSVIGGLTRLYGVRGGATGSGTNYGVYGSASGGATDYGVYCSGDGAYTGTWTDVSDRKFKKNITPMTGILDKVLELNPVTYEMRADEYDFMGFSEGTEYGLIAQDLKEVFPELVKHGVHPGPEGGEAVEYDGIDYISLTSILVSAVQELKAENNELRARIETLENGK